MEKMFSRITWPKSCGEKFWRGPLESTRGKKYLGAGYSKIWQLSKAKENICTQVIINIKNLCLVFLAFSLVFLFCFILFSLLILLLYSLLIFLQLANQTSSNKIKVYFPQNFCNSLVPQHILKPLAENRKPNILNCTNSQKKFNFFKTCNSVALKTLKTIQLWYFRLHEAIDF